MGRSKASLDGKENRAAALQAAIEAARAQLRTAKGATHKVKWAQIAREHGVDRTTLRDQVAGHAGTRRQRVGAGAPTVLPPSEEEALAKWLEMTAAAKKSPTERGIWPYNPEAVLGPLRAELEAKRQLQPSAPTAADVAAAATTAVQAIAALQPGVSTALTELDPEVAAAVALEWLGRAGTAQAEAAAAVLRGERKLAPQRQGKGKKRLSGWITGPEWEAQHQREQEEKQQKEEAAAAKKAAAAAKREAAAGARAEKAQRAQQARASSNGAKRRRSTANLPR